MTIKPWSISTTLRNPERALGFLKTFQAFEGSVWDKEAQANFQLELIRTKLYTPNNIPSHIGKKLGSQDEISLNEAKEIAEAQNYRGGLDLRGRISFSPLKEMGFIYEESPNIFKITEIGRKLINDQITLEEAFLKNFIKWQYPNPLNKDYQEKDGFNAKVLITTMLLIKKVNELSEKPVGLSKDEFDIFVPTLINANKIDEQAQKIIDLRNITKGKKIAEAKVLRDSFVLDFLKDFYNSEISLNSTKYKNLLDYGDNARRYFRITNLFYIRGNGYYFDLEPRKNQEIKILLENISPNAESFDNKQSYIEYILQDTELPWETSKHLTSIVKEISEDLTTTYQNTSYKTHNVADMDNKELLEYYHYLKSYRVNLQQSILTNESKTISALDTYIDELKNINSSRKKLSIELERLVTLGLNAINDAKQIKPNYPVGDDGEPTFTAPAGVPDIECYYETFSSICEVTMLRSRDQWFNEGQPVMRHLRDFEESNDNAYCLFVAPKIHTDTANTFYMSNKYQYKGTPQQIAPITINQFIKILELIKHLKQQGIEFKHTHFLDLLQKIVNISKSDDTEGSDAWIIKIDEQLDEWIEINNEAQHHIQ